MTGMAGDMSMGFGANRNPITPHGRVVYNAKPDMVDYRSRMKSASMEGLGDTEFMTIKRHEPCLMKMRTKPMRHFNTNELLVTGCTNGIGSSPAKLDSVYSGYRFAGIAQSECLYDTANNWVSDELTIQVGGLTTVYNTGAEMIHAGDFVMWEVFDESEAGGRMYPRVVGQPKNKRLVVLKSFTPMVVEETTEDIWKYIFGPNNQPPAVLSNPVHKTTASLIQNTAKNNIAMPKTGPYAGKAVGLAAALLVQEVTREAKSRIVGKAMSTAEPGKNFDVLLGKYAT